MKLAMRADRAVGLTRIVYQLTCRARGKTQSQLGEHNVELTKAEAINLILGFYTTPSGFWSDIEYNIPELTRFIEAGLTRLDGEDGKKIVPNEQGADILFSHFVEISNEFIAFMQKTGLENSANEVIDWFVRRYGLCDLTTGEDIAFLIAKKLYNFGYSAYTPNPKCKNDKFIIQRA